MVDQLIPMKRPQTVEDVAGPVAYVLSAEAANVRDVRIGPGAGGRRMTVECRSAREMFDATWRRSRSLTHSR